MDTNLLHQENGDDEEYVMINLDAVSELVDISPNAPYSISGLNTLNPVLTIGDLKLVGEYEEAIGTVIFFREDDTPVIHEETGPSEANLFSGKCIIDPNQAPRKQVHPVGCTHKIIKFKLAPDAYIQDRTSEQTE